MASFIVQSLQTVAANRSGSHSITLLGTGTTWKSAANFTLSGVTGVAKLGQIVATDTQADIQLTTGSGTGTLTVTETNSGLTATVKVAKIPPRNRWFPGL